MDLAKQYDVSRITSKRALEELKQSGLAYSIRGSGTYVAKLSHRQEADISERKSLYKQVVSMVIPFRSADGGIVDTLTGVTNVLRAAGYMVDINCLPNREGDIRKGLMQICERARRADLLPQLRQRKPRFAEYALHGKVPAGHHRQAHRRAAAVLRRVRQPKGHEGRCGIPALAGTQKIAFVTDKK